MADRSPDRPAYPPEIAEPVEPPAPAPGTPGGDAVSGLREAIAVEGAAARSRSEAVAAEEPMEVRVVVEEAGGERRHSVAVTMRTPGHDRELAAGFLVSEGVLTDPAQVESIAPCAAGPDSPGANVINVRLRPGASFDPGRFSRNVYTSSSCGICGRASLDLVRTACPARPVGGFRVDRQRLCALPGRARRAQEGFARTGGLHASALFEPGGELLLSREDVGRHNAMDKVVGAMFLEARLPLSGTIVLVSGRASFELVQKALLAGIPFLAAVGAPTTLAVDLAREHGLTLIGFLRGDRFNVYSGGERIETG